MANDRTRPRKRRKVCNFCVDKVTSIDFKDAAKLRRYTSERGKILPRRTTGRASASADRRHQTRPSDRPAALRRRLILQQNKHPAERSAGCLFCEKLHLCLLHRYDPRCDVLTERFIMLHKHDGRPEPEQELLDLDA